MLALLTLAGCAARAVTERPPPKSLPGSLPAPTVPRAKADPADPSAILFPGTSASPVRTDREVLIEVVAMAQGARVKGAKVYARGVDPLRPWYEHLSPLDRRDDDVAATPYGTTCFRVAEGTRMGLAAYHRLYGCSERVLFASADGDGQRMRVEIEMPAPQKAGRLEVELTSDHRGSGFVPVGVLLCSPVLGFGVEHFPPAGLGIPTSLWVVPGDYSLRASLWRTMGCGADPVSPDVESWEGAVAAVEAGRNTKVIGAFQVGSTMVFEASEGVAAGAREYGEKGENEDLLIATVCRRGHGKAYCLPERVRTTWRTTYGRDEAFLTEVRACSMRAFPPGDYAVTIEGHAFEPVSVNVTVPELPEEPNGFFGDYIPETVFVKAQLKRRAP